MQIIGQLLPEAFAVSSISLYFDDIIHGLVLAI